MKYWIHTLVILVIGFAFQYFLPWWILIIISIISAFIINQRLYLITLFGFLGGLILWGVTSLYIDLENGQLLSSRIGALLGGLNSNLLIVVTSLIGGLIAGISSYFGGSLRKAFVKNQM